MSVSCVDYFPPHLTVLVNASFWTEPQTTTTQASPGPHRAPHELRRSFEKECTAVLALRRVGSWRCCKAMTSVLVHNYQHSHRQDLVAFVLLISQTNESGSAQPLLTLCPLAPFRVRGTDLPAHSIITWTHSLRITTAFDFILLILRYGDLFSFTHTYVGLARTVYIYTAYDRIFDKIPAKKDCIYTVYIWLTTCRISLRSSSLREPRYPLLRVVSVRWPNQHIRSIAMWSLR